MKSNPYITPALFKFHQDLKENNNREWFNENKERFEQAIRKPLTDFVVDFTPFLKNISPYFVSDPKGNGGSLMRIYRDVRFSPDKRPYKNNSAIQFRHEQGKNVHAPGYYLHLEPGLVFAGAGIWCPKPAVATQIREAIAKKPDEWKTIWKDPGIKKFWSLSREQSLQRPPQGFDKDHELIEDLKLKSFTLSSDLSEEEVLKPTFLKDFARRCEKATPFMAFLTRALGQKF